jgi:hypothetical protein
MMLASPGYKIDNYLEDKLGMVWYSFENPEDREYFMNKKRDLFRIVYE